MVSANEKAGLAGAAGAAFFSIDLLLVLSQLSFQVDDVETHIAAATTDGVAVLVTAFFTPAPVAAEMIDLAAIGFAFTAAPTGGLTAVAGFVLLPTGSTRLRTEVFAAPLDTALPAPGVTSTLFEA